MGGDLPGDRGSPISRKAIGRYLFYMRKRVAAVGYRRLLGVRLAGPCQADETFVRTKAKFNRGRARVNRKFTLVSTYIDNNVHGHLLVYMRFWEFTTRPLVNWWQLVSQIGELLQCALCFIFGVCPRSE